MQMRVRCDCGDEIVSDEIDELVTRARRHATEAHGMDVPPERILALVEPCESSTELLREPSSGGHCGGMR
jgi:predicted small metal-binding protein